MAGHSGSGKSAIIQHIALKYIEQGWTFGRVNKIEDIADLFSSKRFQKNKTIFVFDDPLGKKYLNKMGNNSWQTHEKELKTHLRTAKMMMSCRNPIINNSLKNQLDIVDLDDNEYKLSVDEKRQILRKYISEVNLSEKDCDEIVSTVEKHFPVLCRLYFSKDENEDKGIRKASPLL